MTKLELKKLRFLINKYKTISDLAYNEWLKDKEDSGLYKTYLVYLRVANELEYKLL